MATSTTRKAQKTTTDLKDRVVDINKKALNAADDLINGSIKTGEKWQKLYAKSLKKSQPLIEKQIDMAFDTAESLIDQYQAGADRFRQIFNIEAKDIKKSTKKATTTAKNVAKNTKATAKKAVKTVKTATAKSTAITNLKTISGIGPKMETLLNNNGIMTISDLANANADTLKEALVKADKRLTMLNPTIWIDAAKKMTK